MRKIVFILLFLSSYTYSTDLTAVRKLYYEAANNKNSADKFMKLMETINVESNPLLLSFKGMAYLMQAKYSYNPFNRLSFFSKGKELLGKSILKEPNNIETRFMRFCVQKNAPVFMEYNSSIGEDKKFILENWSVINDKDLKERIKAYFFEFENYTIN